MTELDSAKEVFSIGLVQFLVNIGGGGYTIWRLLNDVVGGINLGDIMGFVFGLAIIYIVAVIMNRVPNMVSKSDGRGILHSLIGLAIVVIAAGILTSVFSPSGPQLGIPYLQTLLFYSISIPFAIHILTDMFTPFGVSLLHPFTPTAFSLIKDSKITIEFHRALYRVGIVLLILAWFYR